MARGDKTVMFTARITEEQNDFLVDLGDGARTKGFEELLNQAMGTAPKLTVATHPATTMSRRSVMKAPPQAPSRPAAPKRFVGKRN